jgi:hypothetical protein
MNVKSMLSRVSAADSMGLAAVRNVWLLLSIIFRKKRLDKIPVYVVIIFTPATQPNFQYHSRRDNDPQAERMKPRTPYIAVA